MRYASAASVLTDHYRAGSEIGEALRELSPEVILMFASINLEEGYTDFYQGLCDALEYTDFILVGGSGDGIYETGTTAHYGICALGITSAGIVTWGGSVETGVGSDSAGISRTCAAAARDQLEGTPTWGIVLADGITSDGTGVVTGVLESVSCPLIGGLTGDDRKFKKGRVFYNQQMLEDSIIVLLASGGAPFTAHSASGFKPLGTQGTIEATRGKEILSISGLTPVEFIKEQTGKPLAEADFGILALAGQIDPSQEHHFMRAMLDFNTVTGAMTTVGSIPAGTMVCVSGTDRTGMLDAVRGSVRKLASSGFKPAAAIVISCVGRKWQLCSCGQEEVQAIQEVIGSHVPLVGFPSFGEIGPFLGDDGTLSSSYFHNATCVICLLGA